MLPVTLKQIEKGREEYQYFLRGTSGGFMTSLFNAIGRADKGNRARLAMGFPGEVYAYMEYMEELEFHPFMFEITD